jgi:hypothetical protein
MWGAYAARTPHIPPPTLVGTFFSKVLIDISIFMIKIVRPIARTKHRCSMV